jgi:hypothetical protein
MQGSEKSCPLGALLIAGIIKAAALPRKSPISAWASTPGSDPGPIDDYVARM